MAKTGVEGLEKLEDMIVRAAETTAAHARAVKAAVVPSFSDKSRSSSMR